MFNLLPKREKDTIRTEYRTRLVVVVLCFSFATFLIAGISLLPSLLLSSQREKSAQERVDDISKRVKEGEVARLDEALLDAKKKLSLLRRESPRIYLYELLVKISSLKSGNVAIENVTVTEMVGGKREVHVGGEAANRTALVSFSRALEGTGLFEAVEIPVSNFAKDTAIPFSINVKGNF